MPSTGPGSCFTTKSESTISNLDTGLGIQAQVAVGSRQQGHGEVGARGKWGEEEKDNLCFSFDCPHKAELRSCVILLFFFCHLRDKTLHLSGLEIAFLTLILSTEDICPRMGDISLWSSSDLEFFSSF